MKVKKQKNKITKKAREKHVRCFEGGNSEKETFQNCVKIVREMCARVNFDTESLSVLSQGCDRNCGGGGGIHSVQHFQTGFFSRFSLLYFLSHDQNSGVVV